jgi:hydroxymethylpyrimidine/phosphomethylpyrimidine kinase
MCFKEQRIYCVSIFTTVVTETKQEISQSHNMMLKIISRYSSTIFSV